MFYKYFLTFLFSLIITTNLLGQSFREPAKGKWGGPVELTTVFTEEGISSIEQKVASLNQNYNYDIAISIGQLPIKLTKRNPTVSQEMLDEFEEETLDNAYKNYSKLDIGDNNNNKGILIDLSFRTADDEENQTATSYTYQHVAFGKEASLLMKVGLGSFRQDTKIQLYSNDKQANEAHLFELVNKIEEYLKLEKEHGDKVLAIGPLLIYYENLVTRNKGEIDNYDWVVLSNSKCVFKFLDLTTIDKQFELKDFNVNLYYDFKNQLLHSASISYSPSSPYSIGELGFFQAGIRNATLSVDKDGNLTGTVNLRASTKDHINLGHMVRIKRGITGDFSFTFAGNDDFSGSFDLAGIRGINIDMMKGNKALASLKNLTFNESGVLSGKLVLNEDPAFPVGLATAEVTRLDLNINYSLKEGLEIPKGIAQLKLKNIKGVKGSLKFDLNYNEETGMTCVLAQEGRNLSGYGCEFSQLTANLTIDSEWNFRRLTGSFKARHPDMDSQININNFLIEEGELKQMQATDCELNYLGFKFNLKRLVYADYTLSFSANLLMKMNSSYSSEIIVDKFTLDSAGNISIGKISGDVKYPAFSMKFNATFSETKFSGSMSSNIKQLGIAVKGSFDVGSAKHNNITYDYGYASLSLNTSTGVFIPGTPLKLTGFGGLGGYNYDIHLRDENDPSKGFTRNPRYQTYVAGIELSVADAANLIGVTGKSVVVMGNELFRLTVFGNVNIPKTKPYFRGKLMLHYSYENDVGNFAGTIGTQVKIPASTGSIFKTENLEIGFRVGPERWWVKTDTISASLFGIINYRGIIDFQGGYNENDPVTGYAGGRMGFDIRADFDEEISFLGITAATARGYLALSIWAAGRLQLEEDYFSLYSELGIKAEGELHCEVAGGWLYECHLRASAQAIGHLEIASDFIEAGAELNLLLVEYEDDGITIKDEDRYDFEACQRLNLNRDEFQDCPETLH